MIKFDGMIMYGNRD